jgi:hypothetical protein
MAVIREDSVAGAKQTVRAALKELPESCTLEDVQYQLYLRQRIEKSKAAAGEGRVVSHDEVKKRLAKWVGR